MAKFALATSWDNKLVDIVATLNQEHQKSRIIEFYGSFPRSLTGSARHPDKLPNITEEEFEAHISYARSKGIEFNYIMNAPELDGTEKNETWLKSLRTFLAYLHDAGVEKLTITHPFLIEFVCNEFPDFGVVVSVIAGVNTVNEAQYYDKMGVERIVADFYTINRNFERLAAIVNQIKCKVELIVNSPCLAYCPDRQAHYASVGRASREDQTKETHDEVFLPKCGMKRLLNPLELIKSHFIRPEDIKEYEKIGIDVFKLVGRTFPTEFLAHSARAYLSGYYEGDLLDIIQQRLIKKSLSSIIDNIDQYSFPISIDNQKLTEVKFIENIKKLRGKELEAYYRSILKDVVRGFDHPDVKKLQELCRNAIQTDGGRIN
jgi:collagenase-like PrtC family protease